MRAPPSKSVLQRAILVSSLARGRSFIRARRLCEDAKASVRAARRFGARVDAGLGGVAVESGVGTAGGAVDCGESGLTFRMAAAIAATFEVPFELRARGSLSQRPMGMIVGPLEALGASCESGDRTGVLRVAGPMAGGREVEVDGRTTSQLLSGMLVALAATPGGGIVTAPVRNSERYVDLTIGVLARHGVQVARREDGAYVLPEAGRLSPASWAVEGDWSGASFALVAGAIAGGVTVDGLDNSSAQPDRGIVDALEAAGARVRADSDRVTAGSGRLRGFVHDATHCPDLFPPLVGLACCCEGVSTIRGAGRLAAKESDRAAVLVKEFRAIGCDVRSEGDSLVVHGGAPAGGRVDANGDHRIAMAAAVVALRSRDGVEIGGADCVAKSYPAFFEDMGRLGARVS